MRRNEEGDDPEGGRRDRSSGARPDPTTRHWRHPSELAGHHALPESRPAPAPRPNDTTPNLWPVMAVGGCLALAAAGVVGLVIGLSPGNGIEAGLVGPADGSRSRLGGSTALRELDVPSTTTAYLADTSLAVGLGSSGPSEPGSGDGPAPGSDVVGSAGETSSWTVEGQPITSTTVRPAVPPAGTELQAAPVFGVYAVAESESSRLASFTVVVDDVVTSASALGGRTTVWVRSGTVWLEAEVAGLDPLTDLAVLDVGEPVRTADDPGGTAEVAGRNDLIPVMPATADTIEIGTAATVGYGPADDPTLKVTTGGPSKPIGDPDDPDSAPRGQGVVFSVTQAALTPSQRMIYQPIRVGLEARPHQTGGPLRNGRGELIGIVIASDDPQVVALPIDRATRVIQSLRERGTGDPAWLGLELWPSEHSGVMVGHVDEDSPAQQLLPADLIVSVDGERVSHPDLVHHLARRAGPGGHLTLGIERDNRRISIEIEIGSAP